MAEVMKKRDIIERIMTMHWDMIACGCWVCVAGRVAGCRPRTNHQQWRMPAEQRLAMVHVDDRRPVSPAKK